MDFEVHSAGEAGLPVDCAATVVDLWLPGAGMARKKNVKRFRAVTAVKELARERVGMPPPTQVVPDRKKRKKEKHRATLERLLGDN